MTDYKKYGKEKMANDKLRVTYSKGGGISQRYVKHKGRMMSVERYNKMVALKKQNGGMNKNLAYLKNRDQLKEQYPTATNKQIYDMVGVKKPTNKQSSTFEQSAHNMLYGDRPKPAENIKKVREMLQDMRMLQNIRIKYPNVSSSKLRKHLPP